MTAILLVLANAAAARAGLSPGQAQLIITGLGALMDELATLKPEDVSLWLSALPAPHDNGDAKDDAGGPFDRDPTPYVPLPENDRARGGGG